MPNIIDENMPALQEALLQYFSNDAVYDPLVSDLINLLVVPTQPAAGEMVSSKFLRVEFRASDLGGVEVARGHRITVKGATYQVIDFSQDLHGWVSTTCEVTS